MKTSCARKLSRRCFAKQTIGAISLLVSPVTITSVGETADSANLEEYPNENQSSFNNGDVPAMIFGAQGNADTGYAASWFEDQKLNVHSTAIHVRGHGGAVDPSDKNRVILFARRPGLEALLLDLKKKTVIPAFSSEKGFHLFGHGCFSKDGKHLFTTESEYEKGDGKIVVRDTRTFRVVNRYDSYGIGPHEIKRLPGTNILVVANGGLLTHPASGKERLNLSSMASNLSYIDGSTGELIESQYLPYNKASIRHIDVAQDGLVSFGLQVQRDAMKSDSRDDLVPLAGSHVLGSKPVLFEKPDALIMKMDDYVGSVSLNNNSRTAGFTSPRGNIVSFWDCDTGKYRGYHKLFDVCGLTQSANGKYFVASNSKGEIRFIDARTLKENRSLRVKDESLVWDNHILSLT